MIITVGILVYFSNSTAQMFVNCKSKQTQSIHKTFHSLGCGKLVNQNEHFHKIMLVAVHCGYTH